MQVFYYILTYLKMNIWGIEVFKTDGINFSIIMESLGEYFLKGLIY